MFQLQLNQLYNNLTLPSINTSLNMYEEVSTDPSTQNTDEEELIFIPDNNPMKQWTDKGRFPHKLIIAILIVLSTSLQVYYLTGTAVSHSRQFTRTLNYFLLDHKDFGYYWMGFDGFNYPFKQFKTLDDFSSFLGDVRSFFSTYNQTTYNQIDQDQYNSLNNSLLIIYSNASYQKYLWTLQDGFISPYNLGDLKQLKDFLSDAEYIQIQMSKLIFPKNNIKWTVKFLVTIQQKSDFMVQIFCYQEMNLFNYHYPGLLCCILIVPLLFIFKIKVDIFDIGMFIVLFLATFYSLRTTHNVTINMIIDGLCCCLSWLWLPHVFPLTGRFNFAVILKKSYILIGRLFLAFLPIFIGFSIMAYTIFSRLTDKYSTFHKSILQLFFICYYNMTYETYIITQKSSISAIFITVFILVFTFTIYSSMLVATFCGYAWHIRQQQLLKDIKSNLVIQCSDCEFKFKYDQRQNIKPQINRSQYAGLDSSKMNKLKDLQRSRITGCYQKIQIAINQLQLMIKKLPINQRHQFKKMIIKQYLPKIKVAENLSIKVRNLQK